MIDLLLEILLSMYYSVRQIQNNFTVIFSHKTTGLRNSPVVLMLNTIPPRERVASLSDYFKLMGQVAARYTFTPQEVFYRKFHIRFN